MTDPCLFRMHPYRIGASQRQDSGLSQGSLPFPIGPYHGGVYESPWGPMAAQPIDPCADPYSPLPIGPYPKHHRPLSGQVGGGGHPPGPTVRRVRPMRPPVQPLCLHTGEGTITFGTGAHTGPIKMYRIWHRGLYRGLSGLA